MEAGIGETQAQQKTRNLTFSEIRYRRLFEAARDGILILDAATAKIADANPFMTELLGYTHEEFLGKELWEIGLFADEAASRAAVQELQSVGYIRYENMPLQSREGERREVEFVCNVYEENGESVIQCNIRDITDRKQAEIELKTVHDRLEVAYARERRITAALQRPLTLEVVADAFPGLTMATLYEPALSEAEVGGDFFDAFYLPGGLVALAVADASGKGLTAAVRAAQTKDVIRAFTREYPYSPAAITARLNDFVCDTQEFDDANGEGFTCLALAVLNPANGDGSVVSAGCEPPVIVRASGEFEVIERPGPPLGVQRRELYSVTPLHLARGDTLLMLTDGITEARRGGNFLGYSGLEPLAQQALNNVGAGGAAFLLRDAGKIIIEGARAFGGGALRDDACLLLARRN